MAEVEKRDKVEREHIVVEVVEEESYVVTLNPEEAELIRSLAGHIHLMRGDGGDTLSDLYTKLSGVLPERWSQYAVDSVTGEGITKSIVMMKK
jgi:hypothetical protein